ncbi:nitrilase-related carbon-nitrogen hydrolase [Microbacterium sp. W4I20]|uniref:nitrilase-related carbon-nitrogen hydrolase n=1 Tax=Microbacterium sp. W4I20 TaxID=3042262 RepID=UPI00277EE3CD|nr:nitrilase-related carbon-nitrogen hydrolase [Microbacterium sp. W4I20]MDQ0727186.1 putative amidohydrolase [Microbacterium sp. W4I20]
MTAASDELRVAALSPEIVLGDVDGNLARIREAITAAARRDARLIVLPELAVSGYVFADRAEAEAAAITRDDSRWDAVREVIPEDAVVVVGYAEIAGAQLFNTAAVLTHEARIADYRKSHLWGAEKLVFDHGTEAGLVVDTSFGRLGVAICYDNEFPEVPRRLALAGADVLALPVNWPLVSRPEGEHAPELIQAMASARSSRLPVVIADRWGSERGVDWTDGTAIIDEQGWIVAFRTVMGATAVLSLAAVREKSLPPHNHLFDDRRGDLY